MTYLFVVLTVLAFIVMTWMLGVLHLRNEQKEKRIRDLISRNDDANEAAQLANQERETLTRRCELLSDHLSRIGYAPPQMPETVREWMTARQIGDRGTINAHELTVDVHGEDLRFTATRGIALSAGDSISIYWAPPPPLPSEPLPPQKLTGKRKIKI